MDDTHGTNSYDFSLITVLVVDEYGEGFPAAWCLCNRTDKYILIDCLTAVWIRVGNIKPKWVMTDDAEQYFSAWVAVFGLGPRKLLCTWHVDRAWRGAVNRIKDKEVAATVYHNIRVLMEEIDIDKFKLMLQSTLKQLNSSDETQEFAKYFHTYYTNRAEQWAACYRKSANINTNMYIESFHRILKHLYMKGKANRRIDNLIHVLLKVSRDKGFERLCKLEKGKNSGRLITIHKRHLASTKLSPALVQKTSEHEWKIKSGEAKWEYTVTMERELCQELCQLICKHCEVCIHMYSCTCLDFLINYTICKHIHLVAIDHKCKKRDVHAKWKSSEENHEPSCGNKHPTIRLAVQQSHNVSKIKDRLNQKLSTLLLLVRNSSDPALLLSAEDHINSASSLLNLTETKSVAQNAQQISKSPTNKHIATQRGFFTTKKKRKPQHKNLVKPTAEDKMQLQSQLLEDVPLYSSTINTKDTIIRGKSKLHYTRDAAILLRVEFYMLCS